MSTVTVLSSLERPTLSAQVARHLLALIARKQLRPGDAVPSEVEIGRELAVSRGSVREAYRSLAALGVLAIESGRRPRLQALNSAVLGQVFDYALSTAQVAPRDVLETRRAIEVQDAQLAARLASDAQRARLRELAAQMRGALDDTALRIDSDMAIHTTLAEASCNPLNALLLGALRSALEQSMLLDLGNKRSRAELIKIVDAHEAIVDRVCAGDAVGAGAAMALHFDMSWNSIERVAAEQAADKSAGARRAGKSRAA